jgi:serine/threonine protein kinase
LNYEAEYRGYREKGLTAFGQRKFTEAIEALGRAVLFRPGDPEAHFNLGRALSAAGKIEAARQAYLRASNIDPNSPEVRFALLALPPLPPERQDFQVKQALHVDGTATSFVVLEVKKGGFGTVYIVVSAKSRKFYALKTFQSKFLWSDEDRQRFEREALTWIQLDRHPNVVSAQCLVRIEGVPCLLLEYVPENLAAVLRERRLPPKLAMEWALQLCDGMFYVHQKLGIVHRDLKPPNCLITDKLTLKITDFGLARSFAESQERSLDISELSSAIRAHFTGVAGTPYYMAPEQFEAGRKLDTRADIFAFGVMFYQMLTQDLPPVGAARSHIAKRASAYGVPDNLKEIMIRCVQPDVRRRPNDFRELRRLLERSYRRLTGEDPASPAPLEEMSASDWSDKGIAMLELSNLEEAVACFKRSLSLNDGNAETWLNYGSPLMELKRFSEALDSFDRGLDIHPTNPYLWSSKAMALESLSRLVEARACHERALELQPKDETLWMHFGALLADMGQFDDAIRCLDRALKINPRDAKCWLNLASNLIQMDRFQEALVSCDNGLAIEPRYHLLWKRRALALMKLGQFQESLFSCERGLEIEPHDPTLWNIKGCSFHLMGRTKEANECFEREQVLEK